MHLNQEQNQRQTQVQRIAPQLIQANTLLQCSNAELLQMIEQEQHENPALDDTDDAGTDAPFEAAGARTEKDREERAAQEEAVDFSFVDYDRKDTAAASHADSDFDPLMLARAPTTLAEQLLSHLRATSHSPAETQVAEYLVDALDDRGYLALDLEEACAVLRAPCSLVMEGIRRLQACDPPGVGARDVRECLLLQMRALGEAEKEDGEAYDPIAEAVIREHWEALIKGRHSHLARRLGVPLARVEAALAFIKTRLAPHPAEKFRAPWEHRPDSRSATVRADVVIRRGAIGFEAEVLGFDNLTLHVNPHYRQLYDSIKTARTDGGPARFDGKALGADHKKHVVAYVERANMFLRNLQQRRRTIQKIALALVETQQGFLETGERRFLRPLTRTMLADMVGMHESTISRALLHKYVQLPSQEVVPFDVFFEQSATVKDLIAAIIEAEDSSAPLSDLAVGEALKARGHTVARRTVVKYREELRIPASYLRRRR